MDKTIINNKAAIDINEVMEFLSVGKNTADKIGKQSGAVFRIGRRKLFNVSKLVNYINSLCEISNE